MFLLSLLTNKDSYDTQIIQCVNDTIFRKRFRVPGFGNLEPVLWNRFLREITSATMTISVGQKKTLDCNRFLYFFVFFCRE